MDSRNDSVAPVWFHALVASVLVFVLGVIMTLGDDQPTGKDVFLKYKCDNCHAVSSAGIAAKNKKVGAPDLIDATVRHDPAWIPRFIRKEEGAGHVHCDKVPKERDGKQHMFRFAGTKEEEAALMEWLKLQKTPEEEERK
ncbi:MAG: c-type cytochrome [Candidatus Harrisonbacteria bacterium]|nr:c-type cytochrome [Candidatus Harrisonbacteria bacterium]